MKLAELVKNAPAPLTRRGEFIALMAMMMSLNAMAIDIMLPALDKIAKSLNVSEANDQQYIISVFLFAQAIGSLFFGPFTDRYGRRPVLFVSLFAYVIFSLFSAVAPSFEMLLVARMGHGAAATGLFVIAGSIVRDRYSGDTMARVMSTIFIMFMIVPVIAPSLGHLILLVASWHYIFIAMAVSGLILIVWIYYRLPETMADEDKREISLKQISSSSRKVLSDRVGVGYMFASGFAMAGLIGFINSAPQIFDKVFDAADIFPYLFAMCALGSSVSNFLNSRIVERFGARRVSHIGTFSYIFVSILQIVSALYLTSLPVFMTLIVLQVGLIGFLGANFGSIAMEPFGHMAGSAASIQSFWRMLMSALIGGAIGLQFDDSLLPLAIGFLGAGFGALLCVLYAEKGKLMRRRNVSVN